MIKKVLCLSTLLLVTMAGWAQNKQQWVDSVFQTLTLEEKIGQLFVLEVDSTTAEQLQTILHATKTEKIGGILIQKGNAQALRKLIFKVQQQTNIPLLVGLYADHSIDSTFKFPPSLILSAVRNDSLRFEVAKQKALQLKSLGINMWIASNAYPADQGLADQLYHFWGNNPVHISKQLKAYQQGLQSQQVLYVENNLPDQLSAKNPNHAAFFSLMHQKIDGVMPVSNFTYPSFKTKDFITSIDAPLTNTQLENKFNYNGLLISNVSAIKTSTSKVRAGEPESFAFQIGNDLLINPSNLKKATKKIKQLVKRDANYAKQLERSVRKILEAKFNAGLASKKEVTFKSIAAKILVDKICEASTTIVKNQKSLLPIKILDNKKIASLSIGLSSDNRFNKYLARYTSVDEYCVTLPQDSSVYKNLHQYDEVIVGIFPFASQWQQEAINHLKKINARTNVIMVHFGNPELLKAFQSFETVIAAYASDDRMIELVAQQIFGALPTSGALPINVGNFIAGHGEEKESLGRLSFTMPEAVAMESKTLEKIKDIAYEAINAKATPGCRVIIARKGKVIYDHAYGWLTYENKVPVTNETVYDLASLTKVSATLQTTAFLYEKGLIDINKKMSVYLPELKGSNKEDFTIKDILTHQAGLWPFLPFWAQTMKDSLHLPIFYSQEQSDNFPFPVTHNLFAASAMKDSLWHWIIKSKVREKPARTPYDYRYSDMGFYMLQHLAEHMLNQRMEDFLEQNIYEPLGAHSLGYLPRNRFSEIQIAPTENDRLFRKSLLTGYVHDQGAAMHGGIAGHAGLFGTAIDLAKLGQLWLNKGTYGGLQYFKPETVSFFTTKQYKNSRRGLGWDKRDFINEAASPTSKYASENTFGHTGFTGTCLWVDPDYDLVFVFLSNRVHPEMTNNKLLNMNIRTRIHDVIYESIFNFDGKTESN